MRLGLMTNYSGAKLNLDVKRVQEAERLGYDSVWTAEAWGSDALTPLAWLGAHTTRIKLGTGIAQMPGRTPAMTAMTAMTLDELSGGRMLLGLGTSGPQVVEGWHGLPWHKPLTWQREYVSIVRSILARQDKVSFEGERYQIPYRGPGSSGLGKPLKSILHGRADLPIYLGSLAPKGQELAGEIADGLLLTCMNPERPELVTDHVQAGLARRTDGRTIDRFDLAPTVIVVVGKDPALCRLPLKFQLALYLGGMGAREKNFHNEYIRRCGFEEAAIRVQDLYLAGKKKEAAEAVPDELVDTLHLVGPPERIRDRFQVWKDAQVGTLIVAALQPEAIRLMAELAAE